MANAVQLAIALRSEPDHLHTRRLMADHGVHLCARKLNVDRPVQHLGGECGDQSMRPDIRLAAKTTTQKMTNDVDLLSGNAENHRDEFSRPENVLRGFIQRKRPVVPDSGRCMWLHLIVMPIHRRVRLLNLDRAAGDRLIGIAHR